MFNKNNSTFVTILISTPLELKDWSNRVEFNQNRIIELIVRILNSPDFKDYLTEEQGKKQILALIKTYDPSILTLTNMDFVLASGIYSVFTSILEKSLQIEVDNSVWLYADIKRMSISTIEIELYF